MIKVDGYVFIPDFNNSQFQPVFGKPVGNERGDGNYANISSNGLTPYNLRKEARESALEFASKRGELRGIEVARLKLRMAETEAELKKFEDETGLVAVMIVNDPDRIDYRIIGPFVEGKPGIYPLVGSWVNQNGFKTFERKHCRGKGYFDTPFKCANEAAYQAGRQGACKASIARFSLTERRKLRIKSNK
jgi:hypothetical protein